MIKKIILYVVCISTIINAKNISLEESIKHAKTNAPVLKGITAEKDAVIAEGRQQLRWENPEIEFEMEKFGGGYDGFDDAEYILTLNQTIPVAKKNITLEVTDAVLNVLDFSRQKALNKLEQTIKILYAELLAKQLHIEITKEEKELMSLLLKQVEQRINVGAASTFEKLQVQNELAKLDFDLHRNVKELNKLFAMLSTYTGEKDITFAEGDLLNWVEQPVSKTILADNTIIQELKSELLLLEKRSIAEKASWFPDVTVSAGYRYENIEAVGSFQVGIGLPLPIINRNQDAIQSISDLKKAKQFQIADQLNQLERLQLEILMEYQLAKDEYENCRDVLEPNILEMEKEIHKGYEKGLYNLIDVISVQHEKTMLKARTIELALDVIQAVCKLEYLEGAI